MHSNAECSSLTRATTETCVSLAPYRNCHVELHNTFKQRHKFFSVSIFDSILIFKHTGINLWDQLWMSKELNRITLANKSVCYPVLQKALKQKSHKAIHEIITDNVYSRLPSNVWYQWYLCPENASLRSVRSLLQCYIIMRINTWCKHDPCVHMLCWFSLYRWE